MQLNEYGRLAIQTNQMREVWYHGLGLTGEAGEVAELLKKSFRPGRTLDVEKLKLELGDVLWYLNSLANINGFTLEEVAVANLAKTQGRAAASTDKMEGWK